MEITMQSALTLRVRLIASESFEYPVFITHPPPCRNRCTGWGPGGVRAEQVRPHTAVGRADVNHSMLSDGRSGVPEHVEPVVVALVHCSPERFRVNDLG